MRGLQTLSALNQYAGGCSLARSDHDRGGSCQTERAGAGDDKHGDKRQESLLEPHLRWSEVVPADEGGDSDRQNDRYEDAAYDIGQPLNGSLAALGILDEPDDLLKRGILADLRRLKLESPCPVQSGAEDLVAGALLDGQALAGQHGLIDRALAAPHDPVHRNLLARPNEDEIAGSDLVDRYVLLAAVPDYSRRLRLQAHQAADGVSRARLGSRFQQAAHQEERDDDRGGLEIDRRHRSVRGVRGDQLRRGRGDRAIEVGGAYTKRDQGVHVGGTMLQAVPRALEERAARIDKDRGCERKL